MELFLNGVDKGRYSLHVRGHLKWDVPYAAGTLKAVGYTNGVAVLTDTVVTTGAPTAITLTPDRSNYFRRRQRYLDHHCRRSGLTGARRPDRVESRQFHDQRRRDHRRGQRQSVLA